MQRKMQRGLALCSNKFLVTNKIFASTVNLIYIRHPRHHRRAVSQFGCNASAACDPRLFFTNRFQMNSTAPVICYINRNFELPFSQDRSI
jgi:hypothetical protein